MGPRIRAARDPQLAGDRRAVVLRGRPRSRTTNRRATWPCMSACASIFSPSAARARGRRNQQRAHEQRGGGEQAGDAARGGQTRTGQAGSWAGRLGRRSEHRRANPLKSCTSTVFGWRSPSAPVAVDRGLSYDASAPDPSVSPALRAVPADVPSSPRGTHCPRSARSARSASIQRSSAGWGRSWRPRTTSSARSCAGRCWRGARATRSGSTSRSGSRGEDPDERYRRVARTFAAWRSDGALRKDPKPAVYVVRAGLPRPRHRDRAHPARLLRPPRSSSRSGPTAGSSRTSGRSRLPARTATGCCARPASTRRPSWSCTRIARARPRRTSRRIAATRAGGRPRRRRRRAPPPVGRRPTTDRTAPREAGRAPRGRGTRVHRRRPPSLRDRAAVPRRAAHDALVRARPAVRLPAGPVPRRRRRADGAADPPRRARPGRGRRSRGSAAGLGDLFEVARRPPPMRWSERFGAAGGLAGGEGRFGLLTRDVGLAPHAPAARRSSR